MDREDVEAHGERPAQRVEDEEALDDRPAQSNQTSYDALLNVVAQQQQQIQLMNNQDAQRQLHMEQIMQELLSTRQRLNDHDTAIRATQEATSVRQLIVHVVSLTQAFRDRVPALEDSVAAVALSQSTHLPPTLWERMRQTMIHNLPRLAPLFPPPLRLPQAAPTSPNSAARSASNARTNVPWVERLAVEDPQSVKGAARYYEMTATLPLGCIRKNHAKDYIIAEFHTCVSKITHSITETTVTLTDGSSSIRKSEIYECVGQGCKWRVQTVETTISPNLVYVKTPTAELAKYQVHAKDCPFRKGQEDTCSFGKLWSGLPKVVSARIEELDISRRELNFDGFGPQNMLVNLMTNGDRWDKSLTEQDNTIIQSLNDKQVSKEFVECFEACQSTAKKKIVDKVTHIGLNPSGRRQFEKMVNNYLVKLARNKHSSIEDVDKQLNKMKLTVPTDYEPNTSFADVFALCKSWQVRPYDAFTLEPSGYPDLEEDFKELYATAKKKGLWKPSTNTWEEAWDEGKSMVVISWPQAMYNLLQMLLHTKCKFMYADGTMNIFLDGDCFIEYNGRSCGRDDGNSHDKATSSPSTFCLIKSSEKVHSNVIASMILKYYVKLLFGIEFDLDVTGSDHAGAFNTAFKVVFPRSRHLECVIHVMRSLDIDKKQGAIWRKFKNIQDFAPVAIRDAWRLHHARDPFRGRLITAFLKWWEMLGEGNAAKHFRETQLGDRHSDWHYSASMFQGICPNGQADERMNLDMKGSSKLNPTVGRNLSTSKVLERRLPVLVASLSLKQRAPVIEFPDTSTYLYTSLSLLMTGSDAHEYDSGEKWLVNTAVRVGLPVDVNRYENAVAGEEARFRSDSQDLLHLWFAQCRSSSENGTMNSIPAVTTAETEGDDSLKLPVQLPQKYRYVTRLTGTSTFELLLYRHEQYCVMLLRSPLTFVVVCSYLSRIRLSQGG
jgi:hypothetical protein